MKKNRTHMYWGVLHMKGDARWKEGMVVSRLWQCDSYITQHAVPIINCVSHAEEIVITATDTSQQSYHAGVWVNMSIPRPIVLNPCSTSSHLVQFSNNPYGHPSTQGGYREGSSLDGRIWTVSFEPLDVNRINSFSSPILLTNWILWSGMFWKN